MTLTISTSRAGSYRGRVVSSRCTAFLGIPYALPPLAHRRFRKPEPCIPQSSDSVFNATHHPAFAVQSALGPSDVGGAGAEDCLYLDVYTPTDRPQAATLPVLVYIHGGGYKFGAPKNWPFHHWVDANPDIIVVSIYYRLTVLGFLAHPDLVSSGLADLNVGLHDQILALKWVNENISAFGGDPSKISPFVFTPSAGGSSVEIQLTAFNGTGQRLFRGAIAHSVYRTPVFKPEEKKPVFDLLLQELGCAASDLAGQMAWLRSVNAIELVQAADRVTWKCPSVLGSWRPVVDGDILADYPTSLIQNGQFADVPVIVGATTHESADVTDESPWTDLQWHWPGLSLDTISHVQNTYQGEGIVQAAGDAMFRSAVHGFAAKFSKSYIYRFDQPAGNDTLVHHSADNWWMFNGARTGPNASVTFDGLSAEQQPFADELIAYWVSFVRTLDPNSHKLQHSPTWSEYQKSDSKRMVLKLGQSHVEDFTSSEKEKLQVWIDCANELQS